MAQECWQADIPELCPKDVRPPEAQTGIHGLLRF
jgi:hypothetical protein